MYAFCVACMHSILACSSRKSCIQDGKELASYLQRRIPSESDWKDKESPSLNNNETTDSGMCSFSFTRVGVEYGCCQVHTYICMPFHVSRYLVFGYKSSVVQCLAGCGFVYQQGLTH